MAPPNQAKPAADKRPRRRVVSQSPKTKSKGEAKVDQSPKSNMTSSVSVDSMTKAEKAVSLDDPAIVVAGHSQPLIGSEKGNTADVEHTEVPSASPSNKKKSSPVVPRAPRAMRRDRSSANKPKQEVNKDEVDASKGSNGENKENTLLSTNPPRRETVKSKREGSKPAQENLTEDKKTTVRFQTENFPKMQGSKKNTTEKSIDRKAISNETIAQQAAIQDAAAMLAQNPLATMASNPLYANLIATNLAQQQIATAQVLANLRASVNGFRPLKNFEAPSAYDASRVPCLTNREDVNTTTNIYVNNLPAHTTDDDLLRLGTCFGPVKSHKAIINQETGLCKGYGFVMYENPVDAETALQQLPLHGLTTSWAKESFSTKLRKLSDNCSTNVYISNLPLDMTPHQLEQLFSPHFVVSLRILLDDDGSSRGVGFVRLRDRDIAQDCIDKLHGKILPGQTTPLQARFADSEAQKRLKQNANTAATDGNTLKNASSQAKTGGLLDTGNFMDPMYLASLQGLQNWTGFRTPQNPSAASFASPQMDMTSPGLNYAQFSPNLAGNNNVNWNHLLNSADIYGNSFFNSPGAGMLGLNNQNSLYSPNSMAASLNSPMAQLSNKSLSPMSFVSTPMSDTSPMMSRFDQMQKRMGSDRMKPTYLPVDVHQQHAKALLEAQSRLSFGMPSMDQYDGNLQQQGIEVKGLEGQDAMMNALGMTGMTAMGPAPIKPRQGLIQQKVTNRSASQAAGDEEGLSHDSKMIEVGGNSLPLTEDGDSLVIDSGSASSIGRFSDQVEKNSNLKQDSNSGGMTKSDSGKVFSMEENELKTHCKESVTNPLPGESLLA